MLTVGAAVQGHLQTLRRERVTTSPSGETSSSETAAYTDKVRRQERPAHGFGSISERHLARFVIVGFPAGC